jgi:hypothetical protein
MTFFTIRLRVEGGPAGVEDALVVGDEDVDAVDVAAVGGDALGQLGDDAHGVLAVLIREVAVSRGGGGPRWSGGNGDERGRGRKRRDGVRGTGRDGCQGGCRRARRRRAAAAPWTASADEPIDLSIYLSFPDEQMDRNGMPIGGRGGADEMSRRCQLIPIS